MSPKTAALLLRLIGSGFLIFGIIFVTLAMSGADGFARMLMPLFDWTGEAAATEQLTRTARWLAAIMSGLSAGFGAFYVFLVAPLLNNPNADARRIARRGGLLAALIWFVVDSTGSYTSGVPSNVAMNVIFLLMLAGPLMLVKTDAA